MPRPSSLGQALVSAQVARRAFSLVQNSNISQYGILSRSGDAQATYLSWGRAEI